MDSSSPYYLIQDYSPALSYVCGRTSSAAVGSPTSHTSHIQHARHISVAPGVAGASADADLADPADAFGATAAIPKRSGTLKIPPDAASNGGARLPRSSTSLLDFRFDPSLLVIVPDPATDKPPTSSNPLKWAGGGLGSRRHGARESEEHSEAPLAVDAEHEGGVPSASSRGAGERLVEAPAAAYPTSSPSRAAGTTTPAWAS